ncbi:RsmB/NOP family class I SAM-dependent RNA methyltransferase [Polluticaenibacter yanchengensis]|uniref:Fmu (Sun) domain-containing protein n=1 Tax=Polluticaenibacter yanchengensis TaxID=3014562 RepID=A0ABT4UNN5_9BACT|nr:Fmu (Sun) domain-containing protein [Chitinophagaceae bacterium LY-5]
MSLALHYIDTAQQIIESYNGTTPLAPVIKNFFSTKKKYGSRDRKTISNLCYNYYRLGHALKDLSVRDRIIAGLFYCSNQPHFIIGEIKPEWAEHITKTTEEKNKVTGYNLKGEDIFPFIDQLPEGIDAAAFGWSHLQQPNLYIRIRPGSEKTVNKALTNAQIPYEAITRQCLKLPNGSKATDVLRINETAVIQDYNSQQTGNVIYKLLAKNKGNALDRISFWDCCAASGGKSLMFLDMFPHTKITVSDIRSSIIENLHKRFKEAGIRHYQAFVADLDSSAKIPDNAVSKAGFDIILADVPCSGSGTWGRTPEELFYFNPEEIDKFHNTQFNIANNAMSHLRSGGYFIYITCSVFKQENENVIERLTQSQLLTVCTQQHLTGYNDGADSMFIAILQKY